MNITALRNSTRVPKASLALVFLILFTPSLILLSTTPPLWRDTDAWHQVTSPPNVSTLVHFGPVYCFGARGPMWLGTVIGAATGKNAWPKSNFFRKPAVTDAGVTGLLLVHHLLLAGALTLLVVASSTRMAVRLGLCGLCVIQTPLYIYAHCVGTEAFTLTLIIAMTALLRWVGDRGRIRPWLWAGYFGLLLLAILTRHPNAVLAAALPGAFLLGGIIDSIRGRDWSAWKRSVRPFLLATAAGVVTIVAANGATLGFCLIADQIPRSMAGYTFQWKLGFMSGMDPAERRTYWQHVLGPNAKDEFPEVMLGIDVDRVKENGAWQTRTYFWQILDAIAKRSPEMSRQDSVAEAEIALNSMIMPFLLRGGSLYWNSVWVDFWEGLVWTPAAISGQLIETTTVYYDKSDVVTAPRNAPIFELSTFKGKDGQGIRDTFWHNPAFYFFPYLLPPHGVYFIVALALAGCLIGFRDPSAWRVGSTAMSVLITALVMWFLTKLFTQDLPRFAAPLYAGVFAVGIFVIGQLADACLDLWQSRRTHNRVDAKAGSNPNGSET